MTWNDDSFVDLYDLLDVWPDADDAALRRRMAELYLESRENLEHQSHRKRFYYRELYEVQLPQARTILLDDEKRRAYDQQLRQYWQHKGKPPAPTKPKDTARPKLTGLPGIAAQPAADDFSDFADIAEEHLPPPQIPQPMLDKATLERRRDTKRRELIKHELIVTGMRWALLGGGAAFLLGGALAFGIYTALAPPTTIFSVIALLFLLGISALAGRQTMRWAKRRTVGVLSQMPYDELLRHCGAA